MNNSIDPRKLGKFLDKNATEEVKKAVMSGKTDDLLSSISQEDRKKLEKLMQDKSAREKLLSSPEVKKLLSQLFGG